MEREGFDITAADMVTTMEGPSAIQIFFEGSSVLVTGGTGFIGKLLVEKLLWSCNLEKVYLIIRPKKGKTAEERFRDYFDSEMFSRLHKEKPEAVYKLKMVEGDVSLMGLGLKEEDRKEIASKVNVIFHVAATVRFDEHLRVAAYINVRGSSEIMQLAHSCKELKSFIYVSTAYSFCPLKKLEETFYKPKITGKQLLNVVDALDDDTLAEILPVLKGEWPNTYVYTKSIAEDIIKKEGVGLPVAIVRPSIVISTSKEPIAGWINNYYGATGGLIAMGLGIIRVFHCDLNNTADLVPADYVVNCMIAAAWETAITRNPTSNCEKTVAPKKDIPIYNYVSGPQKPLTWGDACFFGVREATDIPTVKQIWYPIMFFVVNKYLYLFLHYTLHVAPVYVLDFAVFCLGKERKYVKLYGKVFKFLEIMEYFSLRQWFFKNGNTQQLWKKLTLLDKQLFEFDMSMHDWGSFYHTYIAGARVYLLQDPLETIPQGIELRRKLTFLHFTVVGVLSLILFLMLWLFCRTVFH